MDTCPKCKMTDGYDDDWNLDMWECDGERAWQRITCTKCGFSWNAVYSFLHYEDADTLEEIRE